MHAQRRKKKRSSNRIYRVDLERGPTGYGFSISGEKPCSFSCVTKTSPVYGLLRAGDFLIAVKDLETDGPEINVTRMPHDQIVDIISNARGRLRLAVAERHYFENSSDEDCNYSVKYQSNQAKPARIYHERRSNPRLPLFPQTIESHMRSRHSHEFGARGGALKENIEFPGGFGTSRHHPYESEEFAMEDPLMVTNQTKSLEFKIIVGYLGTIEMPKQIATSSKHTTVKGCIRKLRQEKRTPSVVLMTILPTSLTLTNRENVILANYPAIRLNYVSGSSESNSKYFGLVTSAIYANGMMCDTVELIPPSNDVSVSNSCHVFVVDKNIIEHDAHLNTATQFKIECTRDQVTGYCLEFPTNSEYIVSLIKSMYTRREEKNVVQSSTTNNMGNVNLQFLPRRSQPIRNRVRQEIEERNDDSPQISNNSESTTSSSNSDSGIGFHNDCTNISDRIVVVDFPHRNHDFLPSHHRSNFIHNHTSRPIGIIHEVPNDSNPSEFSSYSANNPIYETVYPRHSKLPSFEERAIDVPEHILDYTRQTIASLKNKINVTQSCDDLSMQSNDNNLLKSTEYKAMQMSADNIVDIAISEFAIPQRPVTKKIKKSSTLPSKQSGGTDQINKKVEQSDKLTSYKLSPKVFGLPRPISMSFENLSSGLWGSGYKKALNFDNMSNSVRDLTNIQHERGFKDGTISEPDLTATDHHHEVIKQANNIRLQLLRDTAENFKHSLNLSGGNSSFEDYFEYKTVENIRDKENKVKIKSPIKIKNVFDSPNTQVQKFIEKLQKNVNINSHPIDLVSNTDVSDSQKLNNRKSLVNNSKVSEEVVQCESKFVNKRQKIREEISEMTKLNLDNHNIKILINDVDPDVHLRRKGINTICCKRFSINLSKDANVRNIPRLQRSMSDSFQEGDENTPEYV
uniref:CSON003869 protein n=1 Tax=Culicoides sonorensis TaxID=179676 RepID=A0A336N0F5_CULSO